MEEDLGGKIFPCYGRHDDVDVVIVEIDICSMKVISMVLNGTLTTTTKSIRQQNALHVLTQLFMVQSQNGI